MKVVDVKYSSLRRGTSSNRDNVGMDSHGRIKTRSCRDCVYLTFCNVSFRPSDRHTKTVEIRHIC